jgi:hypothetical protein
VRGLAGQKGLRLGTVAVFWVLVFEMRAQAQNRCVYRYEMKGPFKAEIAFCNASDLIRLEMENPFGAEPSRPDVVQFVSILSKTGRNKVALPVAIPQSGFMS